MMAFLILCWFLKTLYNHSKPKSPISIALKALNAHAKLGLILLPSNIDSMR